MGELQRGEFSFNGTPMRQSFGISIAKVHDVLLPALRARQIGIPQTDGRYDYGAKNWEERPLILECNIAKKPSRAEMRELAYVLSQKGKIVLWNEPDKYYIGRLYDPQVLTKIGRGQLEFTLEFVCEPFAVGKTITQPLTNGNNPIEYKGTAETPCLIVLKNTGTETITNVQLTAIFKR